MKQHPDTYAVNICSDCVMWFYNRDDSGSADDFRERLDTHWPRWEDAYPRRSHISVILDDDDDDDGPQPHFRNSPCDICRSLPGDHYAATISAYSPDTEQDK